MANPYEENILQTTGFEVPNIDITLTDESTDSTEQQTVDPVEPDTFQQPEQPIDIASNIGGTTETSQGGGYREPDHSTLKLRRAYYKSRKEVRNLPDGSPEKDQWAMENHGVNWATYQSVQEQKRNEKTNQSLPQLLKERSILFNQEAMMSPATGALDWSTDMTNMVLSGVSNWKVPKIPKFEDKGAQAFREISSLVVPFFFLKAKAIQGLGSVHKAGVASPWLVRLGNNPVFSRFAKSGLDLGVGGFTDYVNKINSEDDTLATHWKRGRWFGHQLIPEAWTSDGLGPDDKTRANVLEGIRLGFYINVGEGFVKLIKGGRGVTKTTQYLSETSGNQKVLNEEVIDPLDTKIYKDSNGVEVTPVEAALRRSDEKYVRDLNKLTKHYNQTGIPNKPTVGVHDIGDELQTGLITKPKAGVLEVARQQAQIALNKGTSQGSLTTTISEAFRKLGNVPDEVANRTIVKKLRDKILKAGPYKVELPNGQKLSWKEINNEGNILAALIADPSLPRSDVIKILDNFKVSVGDFKKVNPVAYKALSKASISLLDTWSDINMNKAQAYLIGSEASQISGISEGARYMDDTTAISRANELITDRLELFEIETSIADFNWKGRESLLDSLKGSDVSNIDKALKNLTENFDQKLTDIIPKARKFREMLMAIQENNPEFAKTIRLAYELSEGDIQSIKGLNRYIQNQFGTFSKLIYDSTPEVPSLVNKAFMTNIFNSMLSAISTPVRALTGNFGGFIAEPAHVFYGALRAGDTQQLRRASWMYFGLSDTLQKALPYAGRIFRKASQNSDELGTLFRADIRLEKARGLELAEEFARAARQKGEHGPDMILSIHKELEALGSDATLRFGPNAMTALDGFSEATQKIARDRGLAFDYLESKFPDGNWNQKQFNEAYHDLWKKGWNEDDIISQEAVEWSRREIALNLDTPLTKRLNPLIKKFPILRSIFWFPNTQMNALNMFGKYGNTSRVKIGTDFAGEYAEFLGPFGTKKVEQFTTDEIRAALAKRGIDMSGDYLAQFKKIRNQIRGRVATGNIAVMSAWVLFSQDRIRGDGHWDRKVQKVRDSQGYVRRTYQGLDGKWHSYEFLGPLADWIALTTNVMDNFESVSTTQLEEFGKKMAFILGASITDRSLLGDIEPMFGVLSGNGQAGARWAAPLINSMFPLSGFRNELGKNLYGTLREVKDGDIGEMIRNRNNWLDIFDSKGALPNVVDFVSGNPINKQGGSFFHRVKNNFDWLKTYEKPTKEGQFLIDMEYSSLPHFNVSPGGIPYTTTEKEELATLIGQDGHFNRSIKTIMRSANSLTYKTEEGKTIKGYINILHYIRKKGYTSEDIPEFSNIRNRLDLALTSAKNRVYNRISTANEIRAKESVKRQKVYAGKNMNMDSIDRLLQLNNSN